MEKAGNFARRDTLTMKKLSNYLDVFARHKLDAINNCPTPTMKKLSNYLDVFARHKLDAIKLPYTNNEKTE